MADPKYVDSRNWTLTREYLPERWVGTQKVPAQMRAIYTHTDGTTVSGTWWGVDDGSAEAEAGARWVKFRQKHGLHVPPVVLPPLQPKPAPGTVKVPPRPKYTVPERIDPPSELIDMDADGCSCHTNPPCSFCTTMTEQEADAYDQGGWDALHMLWRAWEVADG